MVLTEEERRERKRIYNKKYRQSENGKEAQKKYRESEKNKEYQKKYRKSEKIKEYKKSEKSKEYQKKYKESEKYKNKKKKYTKSEKNKEAQKRYFQSEKGKKSSLKNGWKSQGLNMENFEEIYERYTMAIFCDICECVLEGNGRNRKCMDHCHLTGEFRNIVCNYCNVAICK